MKTRKSELKACLTVAAQEHCDIFVSVSKMQLATMPLLMEAIHQTNAYLTKEVFIPRLHAESLSKDKHILDSYLLLLKIMSKIMDASQTSSKSTSRKKA